MDSYGLFAVLLLLTGLLILSLEVFLPSGGLLAIVTGTTLAASIACAWAAWGHSNPVAWWSYLASIIVLVPTTIGLAFYILPMTPMGKKLFLEAPKPEDLIPFEDDETRLDQKVGRIGTAATVLNPGGIVLLDGERLHADSPGMMIDQGTPVRIQEVRGMRVLVRPVKPSEMESLASGEYHDGKSPSDFPALDFPEE